MKTKQIGEEKPNNSWEIEKLNLVKEISKAMSYDYSEYDAMSNNDTPEEVAVNLLDDFITKTLQQQREDLIKETKIDLEDEYNNGFEDGVEQANKHLKKDLLSEIESKSVFVKAYKNGPILADSLIITFDDWLELKSGRKSKISYKNLETNLEKK